MSNPDLSLQANETLLRCVLDAIPDWLWVKDLHGVHLACNTAYAAHLGALPQDVVGTTDAFWFGEEAAHAITQTDQLALQAGATTTFEGPMPSPWAMIPPSTKSSKLPYTMPRAAP